MRVYTIGHSTRTLDELIAVLRAHGVEELCDVRAYPGSSRHPQFARASLERALVEARVAYRWAGKELGGYRKQVRSDSPHAALRSEGFRNYADHMESALFASGIAQLLEDAPRRSVALMCAERHRSRCHRSFIADHLAALHDVEIVHILDEAGTEPHRLHEAARIDGDRLVYDVTDGRQPLLWS